MERHLQKLSATKTGRKLVLETPAWVSSSVQLCCHKIFSSALHHVVVLFKKAPFSCPKNKTKNLYIFSHIVAEFDVFLGLFLFCYEQFSF